MVDDIASSSRVLGAARTLVSEEFGIGHVTIQVEDASHGDTEPALQV